MNKKRKKPPKGKRLHAASAPVVTREGPDSMPPPPAPTTGPPEGPEPEPTPPAATNDTRDSLVADLETIAEILSDPGRR